MGKTVLALFLVVFLLAVIVAIPVQNHMSVTSENIPRRGIRTSGLSVAGISLQAKDAMECSGSAPKRTLTPGLFACNID